MTKMIHMRIGDGWSDNLIETYYGILTRVKANMEDIISNSNIIDYDKYYTYEYTPYVVPIKFKEGDNIV